MKKDQEEDPAVHRLRVQLQKLRSGDQRPITELEEKIQRTLGMTPLFPGQFVYIVNYETHEVLLAKGFAAVLGYPDERVDVDLIYRTWHPDDAPILAKLTEKVTRTVFSMDPPLKPFEATLMVDYRVRKANGSYIKVLRHTSIFDVDERTGHALNTISVCQDISNLKTSERVGWQFAGPEVARLNMKGLDGLLSDLDYRPTPREMDVIRGIAQGKKSLQIAHELGLSLHTVNTHRRNVIERTGLANTTAVVRKAIEMGWL
jgi:DNA-binding CsgD family transcriptional regulator